MNWNLPALETEISLNALSGYVLIDTVAIDNLLNDEWIYWLYHSADEPFLSSASLIGTYNYEN